MAESASDNRSVYRLRWVGYSLLIFALIDMIVVLIPLRLTDPAWELQAIGTLVDRVAVPLLGLALVFFGEFLDRRKFERLPLTILSWLCLMMAILYLLMFPLGLLDTSRIAGRQDQSFNTQLANLQKLETQLNQSNSEDLKKLASQLNQVGISVDTQNPEGLKTTILERLNLVKAKNQADYGEQRMALLKGAVRISIGSILASVLFFFIWQSTDWARKSNRA